MVSPSSMADAGFSIAKVPEGSSKKLCLSPGFEDRALRKLLFGEIVIMRSCL
jgi:hypothetical protein